MTEMQGKVVMVTGATSGIGQAAARELAQRGATLVIVGRNPEKTDNTVAEIKRQSGNDDVHGLLADLSVMDQIRSLVAEFQQKYDRLDVLINNAGVILTERQESADGYELTFATNHLNYFLLTNLLLDTIKASAPARIINVSSGAHMGVRQIDWDNLDGKKSYGMGGFQTYSLSKLANILFTRELARKLDGAGVTVNAMHPGSVATGFGRNNDTWWAKIAFGLFSFVSRSPEQGADTIVYLATAPDVEGVTGEYFVDRKISNASAMAQDDAAARKLWDISAEMTGLAVEA
jgi:NAD(P)-dependent dehydrogenase (short-subunit alcohol dehydrogenase family)